MQIREKLIFDKKLSDIKQVEGISSILRSKKIQEIFTQLGFECEEEQRKRFTDMFKAAKKIIRVYISREKICSEEWLKLAKKKKEELEDVDRNELE